MRTDEKRIPVILDTDIGGDIDDTWALAMLLKSPELDVKLVVSDTGYAGYRARIIARMLEKAGRTDVTVGLGVRQNDKVGPQAAWVEGYKLSQYPGVVQEDGVHAIVRTIMDSPEPVTLICIGPLPNIAERTRFVGMYGSIRGHHEGRSGAIAEWNVRADANACRAVFTAPWREVTITPLDTCGQVRLQGERYRAVHDSTEPVQQAVIANYRIWARPRKSRFDVEHESSILFDTVAVYLAFSNRHLVMERMGLRVTEDGFTVPDARAREMDVALDWSDLEAYEDFLVERLLGEVVR